jgi:replicative DNA helicase
MNQGIQLPFTDINLHGGNLVFIGSRPGMGKSQYFLQLISNNVEKKSICLCYFPYQRRKIVEDRFDNMGLEINNRIFLNFQPFLDFIEFRDYVKKDFEKYSPSFIIIDGLERIFAPSIHNSYFNEFVRGLYLLSEEINIPIICSAYISSSVEERMGNRYPYLSDFNSAAIEIFSDLLLVLDRPFYYGYEEDTNGNNIKNYASLITLKNTTGIKKQYDFFYNELNNSFYK